MLEVAETALQDETAFATLERGHPDLFHNESGCLDIAFLFPAAPADVQWISLHDLHAFIFIFTFKMSC
ncbi:hypothetical protein Y1Q_0024686 [Alligator mississippiensis]|uniref:Uncharacterized protein n=1 Tax=Alligator mississippiensis TaxID=8496 RepID=A0A151PH15_ALLMI|nr:hypothetical protein Y1Q_0024686 [Alligator mississippiensis]